MTTGIVKTDDTPKEIQPVSVDPDAPLMVQIMQLSQQEVKPDVEYIKGLLAIKKEIDADEARKAYALAFAAAQADIGGVVKTRKNNQTNSMYAGLDDVIEMSKKVCATHGFSIPFSEGVTEVKEHIRVCATVLHKDGHKEPYHYDVPLGGKGIQGKVNMTAIHAKATSVSYGQRYLLCMIWNIPTKDTDGNPPPPPPKPEVRATTTTELEVIDAICAKLPPAGAGFVLNKGHIQALLIEKARDLLVFEQVDFCANQLMEKFGNELHEPDDSEPEIPGQFEEQP